jgi:protein ImuB
LRGLYGGSLDGVLEVTRGAVGRGARLGCAPGRFSAYAAALRARPRRSSGPGGARSQVRPLVASPVTVGQGGSVTVQAGAVRGFLEPLPVGLLRSRPGLEHLPDLLERLGIRTLGQLSALSAAATAERFGHPGLLARDLAQGRDTPLEPRRPSEPVVERLELPEAASGPQLERALELLVARVLSRPERRGRTLRALGLAARFVEGGTWRTRATLRSASADAGRLHLVLAPKLAELPAPAESIALEVEGWGPPAQDQGRLIEDRSPAAVRRARIAEAVGQLRQAVGPEAALRVLAVDPDSRLPERRAVLAPYPVEDDSR